jgi:NADPH-dependent curcumin reductase CurA
VSVRSLKCDRAARSDKEMGFSRFFRAHSRRARSVVRGLIILDHYADRFDAFRRDMGQWVAADRVRLREDVVDGLENAPAAFIGLLEGRNFGKLLVRVVAE